MVIKNKNMRKYILLTILIVTIAGCAADDEELMDLEPPATPIGVNIITGDNSVRIDWNQNGEFDLDGYIVWRSEDNVDFEILTVLPVGTTEYTDNDVINGRTYYYAVSAYDFNRNSSDLSVVTLAECGVDDEEIEDLEPPAIPRGVKTITGDNSVRIEWYPNGEFDLDGYTVWRSQDNVDFDSLTNLPVGTTEYTDNDVRNGRTYYYAVSAYDFNGNESELSPENAWDTPRPEGRNIILDDYQLAPNQSGFDFSHPHKGSIVWNDKTTDIYFALDTEVNITYFFSDNGTAMQDLGYHENFEDVNTVPEFGYITLLVEAIEGHIYAFYTPDGNFAKVHVRKLLDDSITFDWAYQTDPENIQLAPKLPK